MLTIIQLFMTKLSVDILSIQIKTAMDGIMKISMLMHNFNRNVSAGTSSLKTTSKFEQPDSMFIDLLTINKVSMISLLISIVSFSGKCQSFPSLGP